MRPSHRRHNPDWPRRKRRRRVTLEFSTKILKELYPQAGSLDVPTGRRHPGITEGMYAPFPSYGLVRR